MPKPLLREARYVGRVDAEALRVLLESLKQRRVEILGKLPRKSETAQAVRYALGRWEALLRYVDGSRLEIDNNAARRTPRLVALARKNYLEVSRAELSDRHTVRQQN